MSNRAAFTAQRLLDSERVCSEHSTMTMASIESTILARLISYRVLGSVMSARLSGHWTMGKRDHSTAQWLSHYEQLDSERLTSAVLTRRVGNFSAGKSNDGTAHWLTRCEQPHALRMPHNGFRTMSERVVSTRQCLSSYGMVQCWHCALADLQWAGVMMSRHIGYRAMISSM
ncbi:hypothetical protein KIN20_037328 [Parelaphostrongylus tenuis]|uniref:Uncharacterized protein n=1 Tax=Parelaphostrongylus tenuis TaxID=148309 RepID=A0AAD5RE46_PARTN|nr:hypothetical protein KIN20_037328 [Parelaphostrongylus tenuis]